MTLKYEEIGQRLHAFRLGAGLSADELAKKLRISRTAVYRLEKGEVVKIETLHRLADVLGVSLPTLLGVEIEYISSAVTYFERIRQMEEVADRIVILAGPISFLLASDRFQEFLPTLLKETISEKDPDRDRLLKDIDVIVDILSQRKKSFLLRRPAIVNLISALDIERLLRSGFVGRPLLTANDISERRQRVAEEIEHFVQLAEEEPIGVQIGVVTGTLPHSGFQIFRSEEGKTLTISPFRLGEQPNIRLGVAMITATEEAVALHEKVVDEMWRSALKGRAAAEYLRNLLAAAGPPQTATAVPAPLVARRPSRSRRRPSSALTQT